jgi:hypothetical protein
VRRRVAVVYYPLWVIRYSFRGQTYQALIDAEDGSLAYGKAPGNHLWRAFSLVSACAGACFVGTTVLQNADFLLRSENGLMGLGMVGLMLAGFVAWGYRQFRDAAPDRPRLSGVRLGDARRPPRRGVLLRSLRLRRAARR